MTSAADDRQIEPTPPWRRGAYIAIDQAAFSIANFGVALVVARLLPSGDHGRFAVSFAGLTLAMQFHAAWVTTPLLMLTERQPPDAVRKYLGAVVRIHVTSSLWLLLAGLLAAAATWSFDEPLAECLAAASIGIPLTLTHSGARIMCMALAAPRGAATSSVAGLVAMAGSLTIAGRHLNPVGAWVVMSVAALAGVLATLPWIKVTESPTPEIRREALTQHAAIGRWGMGTAALRWVPQGAPFVLLPIVRPADGLVLAGNLKACLTLMTPPLRISAAFAQAAIPEMVKRVREGKSAFNSASLAPPVLLSLIWIVLSLSFGRESLEFVYGPRAVEWFAILQGLSGLPLFYTVVAFSSSLELAHHRQKNEFLMHFVGALSFSLLTTFLVVRHGSIGVAYTISASYLVAAAVGLAFRLGGRLHQSSGST